MLQSSENCLSLPVFIEVIFFLKEMKLASEITMLGVCEWVSEWVGV
jgi:hypothetical protein